MSRTLVWFRSDLRIEDNAALKTASERGEVLGVFTIVPAQWERHDWGENKVAFALASVRELHARLAEKGIPLQVLECQLFTDAVPSVLELAEKNQCDAIYYNEEYEVNELARDAKLAKLTKVEVKRFSDQTILPVRDLRSPEGKPYQVYTPFRRHWSSLIIDQIPKPLAEVAKQDVREIPDLPQVVLDAKPKMEATHNEMCRHLRSYLDGHVLDYASKRGRVDLNSTSQLSAYLAMGSVSAKQCLHELLDHFGVTRIEEMNSGGKSWANELVWRDFYRHILWEFPHVCRSQPFRKEAADIKWSGNEDDFKAWCLGKTGYPIIDAAMRCLNETGWMHNRLRMVVAMFLTKDLLLNWQWGERYFMNHLTDADFASNNGGWQWSASTGNDAAPYFRIFNPSLQAQKFDPKGDFVRHWIPELAHIEGAAIHEPGELDRGAEGYPAPIVDHKAARLRAIDAYRQALRRDS